MKYEYFCFECGSTEDIEHHHVVPKSLGGTKTVPLCIKCHSLVHQKNLVKFRELAKKGIQKRISEGGSWGRTKGSKESTEKFLRKEKNQQIKEMLEAGYTYLEIKTEIGCSQSTISKVKKWAKIDTTEIKLKKRTHRDIAKSIKRKQELVAKSLKDLENDMKNLKELKDKTGYNNIDDLDPSWIEYINGNKII